METNKRARWQLTPTVMGDSESPISLWTAGGWGDAARGDPRTHANSKQKGRDLSGKHDLVIERNPAGSPASMFGNTSGMHVGM